MVVLGLWIGWMLAIGFILFVIRSLRLGTSAKTHTDLRGKLYQAKVWLTANGYDILKSRPTAEWVGYYDKDSYSKVLRADFLVAKGADRYIVKIVKDGDRNVSGESLRDDLYPLCVAFQVRGILHLDLDEDSVHRVDFELRVPRFVHSKALASRIGWLFSGALITFIWLYRG